MDFRQTKTGRDPSGWRCTQRRQTQKISEPHGLVQPVTLIAPRNASGQHGHDFSAAYGLWFIRGVVVPKGLPSGKHADSSCLKMDGGSQILSRNPSSSREINAVSQTDSRLITRQTWPSVAPVPSTHQAPLPPKSNFPGVSFLAKPQNSKPTKKTSKTSTHRQTTLLAVAQKSGTKMAPW